MQHLWIPQTLPGLNEALNKRGAGKGFSNPWATMKAKLEDTIGLFCRHQQLKPFAAAHWTYLFNCPSRAMDKRNRSSAAAKVIEDALKENGYIPNDGWDQVLDYRDHFRVCQPVGVHLFLHPTRVLSFDECLEALGEKKVPAQRCLVDL
jgi:hypothetical protein